MGFERGSVFGLAKLEWVLLAVAGGFLAGLGGATFQFAEGASYLSTDPAACANCHIMQSQYDSWQKASHHTSATCVECHLPADFIGKYIPEPIRITPKNAAILQANCEHCHSGLAHELTTSAARRGDSIRCVQCHSTVGHGENVGLGGPWRPGEIEENGNG
jgi:cytochrome c nitrite reductase small subunit